MNHLVLEIGSMTGELGMRLLTSTNLGAQKVMKEGLQKLPDRITR